MRVAVLGIGLLGRAVAERLQATGHTVIVYNRTRAKAEPLQSLGITVARSAAHAMKEAACTLLFLTDARAICSLLLTADTDASLAGQTIVQMGTIGPGESRNMHQAISRQGGDYFEAPVLGSIVEAKAGTLLLMVGGTQEQLQRLSPVFRALSKKPRLVGPVGHAATLKLALNQLIATETAAFSLSLALVQQSRVPVELFMSILKESALFAPTFEKKFPRLDARHYDGPNFSTRHLLKDVELFLTAAKEHGVRTAGLHGVRDLLSDAIKHGHGEEDYSALYEEINPRAASG
jgi:3-hydroxyisobutyrate dehydrogenase